LLNISGFGEARVEKFGKDFLDIILEYSGENNLVSLVHEKSALKLRRERARTKKKKTDTYSESFKMFQQGLPVAEIAKARGLASGTIETHLVRFVESGEINIDLLVDAVKQDKIRSAIGDGTGHSVTAIRQKLGEEISYNEIRWVVAAMRLNQSGT
jgi:ATP-dependent DNA helicase RecQ